NLSFVWRWGVLAAAWSSLVGYGIASLWMYRITTARASLAPVLVVAVQAAALASLAMAVAGTATESLLGRCAIAELMFVAASLLVFRRHIHGMLRGPKGKATWTAARDRP